MSCRMAPVGELMQHGINFPCDNWQITKPLCSTIHPKQTSWSGCFTHLGLPAINKACWGETEYSLNLPWHLIQDFLPPAWLQHFYLFFCLFSDSLYRRASPFCSKHMELDLRWIQWYCLRYNNTIIPREKGGKNTAGCSPWFKLYFQSDVMRGNEENSRSQCHSACFYKLHVEM